MRQLLLASTLLVLAAPAFAEDPVPKLQDQWGMPMSVQPILGGLEIRASSAHECKLLITHEVVRTEVNFVYGRSQYIIYLQYVDPESIKSSSPGMTEGGCVKGQAACGIWQESELDEAASAGKSTPIYKYDRSRLNGFRVTFSSADEEKRRIPLLKQLVTACHQPG